MSVYRRIFGRRVDSLQLLPFVHPTDSSLFACDREKVKLDRGFFTFFLSSIFCFAFPSEVSHGREDAAVSTLG